MKRFLLSFILLISLSLSAQVNIKLTNTSGSRLEAITVNGISVGAMDLGETKVVTLASVKLMDRTPLLSASVVYGKKKLESEPQAFCGTPPPVMSIISEGNLQYDILILTRPDGEKYLALSNSRRGL